MELTGRKLGRYSVGSLIGSGGMGEVYQAEDLHIRRKVAMKVVCHELAAYPNKESQQEAERLFRREIRAIANLDHPLILPLYDYGEETIQDNIYAFMVMPLRHEGSLAQWLRQQNDRGKRLRPEEIVELIRQAARALQYAHRHHIVHQDVKPSNFLIRTDEERPQLPDIQLADFGIARLSSATASQSQTARGTPNYMAPEQWSGQPVPATDQYALACMAYQLITGDPPFRGRSEQIMYQHFNVQAQPTRMIYSDIPTEVDVVLLRALNKKPAERFADILSFANELQQALQVNAQTLRKAVMPTHSAPLGAEMPVLANSKEASEQQILRATLAINPIEAQEGTTRTLTLPGGYKANIKVPAGASEGQIIRLEKQGDMQNELHVTIAIKRAEEERYAGYGGIFFGGNQNTGKSYYMQVGNDGTCAILVFQGTLNNLMLLSSIPLNFDRNIIYTPEDAQNLLAVSIHNHIISFFVNMKEIGILKDDLTNIQMYVGFGAGGRTQPSGATFQNAKVWQ